MTTSPPAPPSLSVPLPSQQTATIKMTNSPITATEFISCLLKYPYTEDLNKESQWYNSLETTEKQALHEPLLLIHPCATQHQDKQTFVCNTSMIESIEWILQQKETRDSMNMNKLCVDWQEVKVIVTVRLATTLIHLSRTIASCAQVAGNVLHRLAQSILASIRSASCSDRAVQGGLEGIDLLFRMTNVYQGLLLHVVEPIAGMNVVCATIWRDMAEMSVLLCSRGSMLEEKHRLDQQTFLFQAMDRLLTLIRQGLYAAVVDTTAENGKQGEKMGKLLKFFFLRLLQLIPLLDFDNELGQRQECKQSENVLERYLKCMLEFKGMMVGTGRNVIGAEIRLLLTGKLDMCLEKLMECRHGEDCTSCGFVGALALKTFLRTKVHDSFEKKGSRFWIGKWCTMLDLLETWIGRMACRSTMFFSTHHWDDIESICDTLFWQTIPMCHDMIASNTELDMVARTLDIIGAIFLMVEKMSLCQGRVNGWRYLHRMLFRWLGGCYEKGGKVHPLTSELVLAVVQIYMIQSFMECNYNHSIDSNVRKNRLHFDLFLRSLHRLLFDDRVSTMHRRNIGIIITRIMGLTCPTLISLRNRAESIMVDSLIRFLNQVKKDDVPAKKRKRSGYVTWQSSMSLMDVAPLIHGILSKKTFWLKLDSSSKRKLINDFSALLLIGDENLEKKLQRMHLLMTKAPDLLCITSSFLWMCDDLQASKKEEILDIILLALSHENVERGDMLASCRLAHYFVSNAKKLTPRQHTLYINAMTYLSSPKSSIRSNFGGALFASNLYHAIVSKGALESRIPTIFLALFHSKEPSLMIRTMFSMESFATKVPPSHRELLPKCIPSHCQLFLQCRFKRELYCFVTGTTSKTIEAHVLYQWRSKESKTLSKSFHLDNYQTRTFGLTIDPSSTVVVLEHPSDSTRQALVIFPPRSGGTRVAVGDLGEWRTVRIGQMHRVSSKLDGKGCSIFMGDDDLGHGLK